MAKSNAAVQDSPQEIEEQQLIIVKGLPEIIEKMETASAKLTEIVDTCKALVVSQLD